MFDPNSPLPRAPEARVTARGVRLTENGKRVQVNTRSDFVAPDLSPVRTIDLEAEKGRRGWTDFDKKVPALVPGGIIRGRAAAELAAQQCAAKVIRKERPALRVMYSGPKGCRG